MSNSNNDQLLAILSRHIGKGNGIGVKQLAQQLNCPERHIRTLVSALREDGHAVCGTPKDGYYIAATAEELEETCLFIRRRSMHGLRMESQMRKIPLTDLLGQLHLPT